MAWPKGKTRKQVAADRDRADIEMAREALAESDERIPFEQVRAKLNLDEPPDFDLMAIRRRICAHYVRRQTIPRDIRIHNYLPLSKAAEIIRREMTKAQAPDSEVEAYVAKHVRGE